MRERRVGLWLTWKARRHLYNLRNLVIRPLPSPETHEPVTAVPSTEASERSEILATANSQEHAVPTASVSAQAQVVSRGLGDSL